MLSIGAATAEELEISSQEDREAVASDLLNVLHRCVRSSLPQMHLLRADQLPRAASPFSPLRTVLLLCIRSASSPQPFWTPSERRERPLHRLPVLTRTYGTFSQFSLRLRGITYWMTTRVLVPTVTLYQCLAAMRDSSPFSLIIRFEVPPYPPTLTCGCHPFVGLVLSHPSIVARHVPARSCPC